MNKLLLDISGFPEKFDDYDIIGINSEIEKRNFIERRLINKLNNYNPKLKISKIEYVSIKNKISNVISSVFSGIIIKEYEIKNIDNELWENKGYEIVLEEDKQFARRILAYVFLSANKEEGRNVLFSQSIFPNLIDYMDMYINSSSFTIINHPVYFINIINKVITADSLIRRLALIISAGFNYIELFDESSIEAHLVPKQIESFLDIYEPSINKTINGYENSFFSINFVNKNISIKSLAEDHLSEKDGTLDFHGSYDKFYWMEILFIAIIAAKNGYTIDFSGFETFITNNKNKFSPKSGKMARCVVLLEYFKKLSLKQKYHETI